MIAPVGTYTIVIIAVIPAYWRIDWLDNTLHLICATGDSDNRFGASACRPCGDICAPKSGARRKITATRLRILSEELELQVFPIIQVPDRAARASLRNSEIIQFIE